MWEAKAKVDGSMAGWHPPYGHVTWHTHEWKSKRKQENNALEMPFWKISLRVKGDTLD